MNPRNNQINLIQIYAISALIVSILVALGSVAFAVYLYWVGTVLEFSAAVLDREVKDEILPKLGFSIGASLLLGLLSLVLCIGCTGMLFRRRWGRILSLIIQLGLLLFSLVLVVLIGREIANQDLVLKFTNPAELGFVFPPLMLFWSVWGLWLLARKRSVQYFEPQNQF
ncbi:MAG: hypothetical protein RLZZ519_2685 [Bacteroidota bacterium]|jgi:hypothetical protein